MVRGVEKFKEIIEQVADDTGCAAVVIEKEYYDVGVKRYFAPNRCLRIASLLRNSTNIRNPRIYGVNRYFLMFGGSSQ